MSLIQRLFGLEETARQSPPDPTDDYWYTNGPTLVSVRDALALPAYGSGVRYIAETIASLPIHIYERTEDGGRPIAREHPAYRRIHDTPNDYYTAFEYYEQVMRDLLTIGGHLSLIETTTRNDVSAIRPVLGAWSIHKDSYTGVRVFRVTEGGETRNYIDSEVVFIPGPGSTPWELRSLIEQHGGTLGLSRAARDYVHTYFRRGAVGPMFYTQPNMMGGDAKKKWTDFFRKNYQGAHNAGSIPVLDGGGELKSLNIDHGKMQLVDLQRWMVEEVARILRVPPHKIQDLARSTNNNIEHQGIEAVVDCLRPWCKRVESRLTFSILGPIEAQRYYIEFDLDGLLRGDSAAQAALMAAEIQNAVATPNEWRRIRNRPRSEEPNADALFIQGATLPISMAGQQQQQKQEVAK